MRNRFRRTSGTPGGSSRAIGAGVPREGDLCVAPRANSAAIPPSSRLADPAPRRSRCSGGFIHGLLAGIVGRARSSRGLVEGLLVAALAAGGCNYSFISGAGLPSHIRTVAILPFENETGRFELTQEVHEALLRQLPRALGLNQAGEETADAVISGTIARYSLTAPLYRRGQQTESVQVLQREVVLQVKVEILDREEYTILWDASNLRVTGQYLDASESEEVGRAEAIELLVQKIVDGAQSNW